MEFKENTYLLCKDPRYKTALLNSCPEKNTLQSSSVYLSKDDLKYYTAYPVWMKCRLCIFWTLWASLVFTITLLVIIYFFNAQPKCTYNRLTKNVTRDKISIP